MKTPYNIDIFLKQLGTTAHVAKILGIEDKNPHQTMNGWKKRNCIPLEHVFKLWINNYISDRQAKYLYLIWKKSQTTEK